MGEWRPAMQLEVGQRLLTREGVWLTLEELRDTGEYTQVYNFRVEDFHTYFVGVENWSFGLWAHNVYTNDPQLQPDFYEITTPTHGKVKAYRNLYRGQLDDELKAPHAKNQLRVVITPDSDPLVTQQQLQQLALQGDRVVLFTVTTDEHMQIVPKKVLGGELRHTNASLGLDVIAAGEGVVRPDGLMSVSNGLSGHHLADMEQSVRIAEDTLMVNEVSSRFRQPR